MDGETKEISTNEPKKKLVDALPPSIGKTDFESKRALVSGIITTNETYSKSFYEKIKKQFHPNGYIYGVGAGGVFTMLDSFEEAPLGIIMVDIDPAAVLAGKILISGFKKYKDWNDFIVQVINRRNEKLVEETMNNESDQTLRNAMISNLDRFNEGMRYITMSMGGVSLHHAVPLPSDKYLNFPFDDFWAFQNPEIVPITMMARNYQALRQLALDGQLAVVNGSIFNPELLKLVASLPKIKDYNNAIYTSNIGTLSVGKGLGYGVLERENPTEREEDINSRFGLLNLLRPPSPHKNIFISDERREGVGKGSRMVARTNPAHYTNGVSQKPLIRA